MTRLYQLLALVVSLVASFAVMLSGSFRDYFDVPPKPGVPTTRRVLQLVEEDCPYCQPLVNYTNELAFPYCMRYCRGGCDDNSSATAGKKQAETDCDAIFWNYVQASGERPPWLSPSGSVVNSNNNNNNQESNSSPDCTYCHWLPVHLDHVSSEVAFSICVSYCQECTGYPLPDSDMGDEELIKGERCYGLTYDYEQLVGEQPPWIECSYCRPTELQWGSLEFRLCLLFCEHCQDWDPSLVDNAICYGVIEDYQQYFEESSPWLGEEEHPPAGNNNNNASSPEPVCFQSGFDQGPFWYSSREPFQNLQMVQILAAYNNTSNETQKVIGRHFQLWTNPRDSPSGNTLDEPPTTLLGDFDGVYVQPGKIVHLAVTTNLTDTPNDHDTIFMRVFTSPGQFAPAMFNLTFVKVNCYGNDEEDDTSQPEVICPERFLPQPWWYISDPPYQNIQGVNVAVEYKNLLNKAQRIIPDEFQVWTKPGKEGLSYDIPQLTFDPSHEEQDLTVQPDETIELFFYIDLSDTPWYHDSIAIRVYTFQAGTTSPTVMEIVSVDIECVT